MQYWLGSISQMYSLVSGLGKKIQKGFAHVFWTTVLFPVDFFFKFMCRKWASSWSLQGIQDFLCAISFPKDNITGSEGRHCRPKTQLQKLHTVTSGTFYWPKQLMSPYRRELNSTFDSNMCSNHENTTLGSSATGKVIKIFSCCTLNALVSTCKSHNSCGLFPGND